MKFATVEFVAVVTTLMRKYRVDAERKEGESVEEARSRAFESTLNGTTQVVQGFKEPFGLVFEERRV